MPTKLTVFAFVAAKSGGVVHLAASLVLVLAVALPTVPFRSAVVHSSIVIAPSLPLEPSLMQAKMLLPCILATLPRFLFSSLMHCCWDLF